MKMIREFYADLSTYGKCKRWMIFDFYINYPVTLLLWPIIEIWAATVKEELGYTFVLGVIIKITFFALMFFLILSRKQYSYTCLLFHKILMRISDILSAKSVWMMLLYLVILILVIRYYGFRQDFFYKEKTETNKEKYKRRAVIIALGMIMAVCWSAVIIYDKEQELLNRPSKSIVCVSPDAENEWTDVQAGEVAVRWVYAVERNDTKEMEAVLKEMLVQQEMQSSSFFGKTEYQAGIDQNKCNAVLASMNAETQGMAYYSLARIGHYYHSCTRGSREMEVRAEEKESGIQIILSHGKEKEIFSLIDMNEIAGEEGKQNLRELGFSDEEIVSLLASVYQEKDIQFIVDLAAASDQEEYRSVFRYDPDRLSAYAQDALYQYAGVLMRKGFDYNEELCITRQEFEQFECFINGILYTENGGKDYRYTKRYLKIMADIGTDYMNDVGEQLQLNYNQKETVKKMLPDFTEKVQLCTLFETLNYNKGRGNVQIEGLGLDSLPDTVENGRSIFDAFFSYYGEEVIDMQKTIRRDIAIAKYEGVKVARLEEVRRNPTSEDFEAMIYGAEIIYWSPGAETIVAKGKYDANALLKWAWLENEGFMYFRNLSEESKEKIANAIKSDEEYLFWTGKVRTDENGNPCQTQSLLDIEPVHVGQMISYYNTHGDFNYDYYDIITDYYLAEEAE